MIANANSVLCNFANLFSGLDITQSNFVKKLTLSKSDRAANFPYKTDAPEDCCWQIMQPLSKSDSDYVSQVRIPEIQNPIAVEIPRRSAGNSGLASSIDITLSSSWTAATAATANAVQPVKDSLIPQMLSNVFALHSKADAKHIIYLDFNGHKTSGTFWNDDYNAGKDFSSPAFTMDSSTSFSAEEREVILDVWRRVAEDFRPFNVDVTTAAPPTHELIKSSATDDRWGIRVVIGGTSTQWLGGNSAGIAYQNSFNFDSDTPTFIFSEQFTITDKNVAEAISHEVGHTLGLEHDGRTSPNEEYYNGHGSGDTGWAPIMGTGYYQTLTQWSKGQYTNASNSQDDLKTITSGNGFGYRDDDHGSFLETSTLMVLSDNRFIGGGIIERNTDVDYFTFGIQTSSDYQLNVLPYFRGPNLDIQAVVYNEDGKVLYAFNPSDRLSVTEKLSLTVGKYHVRVRGVGKAGTDGYSNYGSLGTYYVRVIPKTAEIIVPTIQVFQDGLNSKKAEGTGGSTTFRFRLLRQGNLKIESRVDWRVTGVSANNSVDRFDFVGDNFASGTAQFEFGNYQTFLSFAVKADTAWEKHERLQIVITNPINGTITRSSVVGTIYNDDSYGQGLANAFPAAMPKTNPGLNRIDGTQEEMVLQPQPTLAMVEPCLVEPSLEELSDVPSLTSSTDLLPIERPFEKVLAKKTVSDDLRSTNQTLEPMMLSDSNLLDFQNTFICDIGTLISG